MSTAPDLSWIYDDSIYKVVLVTILYTQQDGTVVHYEWSTEDILYIDEDGLAHQVEGLIKALPAVSSSIEASATGSNLQLMNYSVVAEGTNTPSGTHLDNLLNSSIEGRTLTIRIIDVVSVITNGVHNPIYNEDGVYTPGAIENAQLVYAGKVGGISATRDTVTISMLDPVDLLDTDFQFDDEDFYSGIVLSGEENTDQPVKPISYGYCFNASPILIDDVHVGVDLDGVEMTGALYQVHNGEVSGIFSVRESGNEIWNPIDYVLYPNVFVDDTNGTILIGQGDTEGHGTITCDLRGKASVANHSQVVLLPGIIEASNPLLITLDIIEKVLGVSQAADLVNYNSFERLEEEIEAEDINYTCGKYITEITSALELINEFLSSIRCYLYTNEFGKISVNRFLVYDELNTDKTTYSIAQDDIINNSYNLTSCEIPNTKVVLNYKFNNTVQPVSEQAAILGVRPEDRDPPEPADPTWYDVRHQYASEYLTVMVDNEDTEVLDYVTAKAADTVDTLLYYNASALEEATTRMAVRETKRKLYTLKARHADVHMRVGDFIRIQHFLYNSGSFVHGTIIGLSKDYINMVTTIEVFV